MERNGFYGQLDRGRGYGHTGRGRGLSSTDLFDLIFNDILVEPSSVKVSEHTFPPCDFGVHKETKDLVYKFAVAGIPKEAIEVSVKGDYLYLSIKEKEEETKDDFHYYQKRIKTSAVSQKYYVPSIRYKLQEIKVSLKDGMLEIIVPAKEEEKPKQIEIN